MNGYCHFAYGFAILRRISHSLMRDLADELRCDASNITQIVARLEARELIERQANPDDRRSRQLTRTPAGDALNAAFEQSFEFARNASSNLTADEQAQFARLLRKALNPPGTNG